MCVCVCVYEWTLECKMVCMCSGCIDCMMHDGMAWHGMYETVCMYNEKHGWYVCVMMEFDV